MGLVERLKTFQISANENVNEETPENTAFKAYILNALAEKTASIPVWYDYTKEKQLELIHSYIENRLDNKFKGVVLSEEEKIKIAEEFIGNSKGFGPLDSILTKSFVKGVIVNSTGTVYIETSSGVKKDELCLSQQQIYSISKKFAANSPINSHRVNNLLVTIISQPVSDCALIIRKINEIEDKLSDLTGRLLITEEIESFIEYLLREKKNIIISGNAGGGKSDFLQVLINSISSDKRLVVFKDCGESLKQSENIMNFNPSSLKIAEFENLFSASVTTNPDYMFFDINNASQICTFYELLTPEMRGVITTVRGASVSNALSKFTGMTAVNQKTTEKYAKSRLVSLFDYIINIEKTSDGVSRIQSVMEITSTKSSALVQNEIIKLGEDQYILDLPEIPSIADREISNKPSASFLERLHSSP